MQGVSENPEAGPNRYAGGARDMQGVSPSWIERNRGRKSTEEHDAIAAYLAKLVNMRGAAAQLGLTYDTVRQYRSDGVFPEPDFTVGRTPLWLPRTLTGWQRSRPGRGWWGTRSTKDAGANDMQGS